MKKLGFCILHYGAPYLREAVASVYEQVDKVIVLYSKNPSQGFGTDLPCPDTEDDLRMRVKPFAKFFRKFEWIRGNWGHEGAHVGAIEQYWGDYDWVWRFDSDEITPPGMVDAMIAQAKDLSHARYLVHFQHFWRCFNKVHIDGQTPVRLFRPGGENSEKILDSEDGKWRVHHMGYAMPDVYMRYKWQVQAHKPELRPEWFDDVWHKNAQENCHPVANGLWPKAQDFDKNSLPSILKNHPFYNLEIIK